MFAHDEKQIKLFLVFSYYLSPEYYNTEHAHVLKKALIFLQSNYNLHNTLKFYDHKCVFIAQ